MELKPITRQEKIIAGQDLTPITRMEKFLKQFGGGGGGAVLDSNGKLKQDVLPDGYPYKEVVERREALIENYVANATVHTTGGGTCAYDNLSELSIGGKFQIGTYIVVVDGVEHTIVNNREGNVIGNKALMNASGENTGEAVCLRLISGVVRNIYFETAGEHIWSLYKVVPEEVYHKMDENFMPLELIDITVEGTDGVTKTYKVYGYEVT